MLISKKLIEIQQRFEKFTGELLDKKRKELYNLIVEVVNSGEFLRKDEGKIVNLWYKGNYRKTPDLVIGVDNNRNIWVCDDGLWGTIEGYYEAEQERYMNRY